MRRDNLKAVPLISTEQHASLTLGVDSVLPERVAVEAAGPLEAPVFPAVAYGVTPNFRSFLGTNSLRVETYMRIVRTF